MSAGAYVGISGTGAGKSLWSPAAGGDFFQVWTMGRAIRAGENPYVVGCPESPPCVDRTQYYPVPAGLVAVPFTVLPAGLAAALFVGLSAGLLAFAATRDGFWRLPLFLSCPFFFALRSAQWSPLLMAAALTPGLGWLLIAKPQLGAALFARRPAWRTAVACGVFLAISFLVMPRWPLDWWGSAGHSPYVRSPVLAFGWFAPVLLLAALRWRTREGRLLLALALLPQTPFLYDQLLLWLVPRTHREALTLTWFSWAMLLAWFVMRFTWATRTAYLTTLAPFVVLFLFVPCLVMVLRRPNEGELAPWLERLVPRRPGTESRAGEAEA